MALIKVARGRWESPHYALEVTSIHTGVRYWSITCLASAEVLTRRLRWRPALDQVALLEDAHALRTGPGLLYGGPLVTGDHVHALRNQLFPGVRTEEARQRLAAALVIDPVHLRHLESGNRTLSPRMADQLRRTATRLAEHARRRVQTNTRAMVPVHLLYEALTDETHEDRDPYPVSRGSLRAPATLDPPVPGHGDTARTTRGLRTPDARGTETP